ncbi:hypothetical protein [Dietzia timorensis]|uniref:Uncharacterized protein n=1 Tax=Dietzia timorensis TaxID=499555 RepID=A0A173LJ08_9ACTN|nr:hypothetical protein [Dietzia timorensis]ANI91257.1 Hypothetical protein BJL86_0450 [Dietzia timorensis]
MNTDQAARRELPAQAGDENSIYFVPPPLRSHYQTVSIPDIAPEYMDPGEREIALHLVAAALSLRWFESEMPKGRIPGADDA